MALIVSGVALLGAACGTGPEPSGGESAASVRAVPAESATVTEWAQLYGRVTPPPDRDATLAPQVAGTLLAVPVLEGQTVSAGEVVARVDPRPLDDAVIAAEASERRAAAEQDFRQKAAARTRRLYESGVASREEAEQDEAAAVAAEAGLAEAGASLATARRRRGWAALEAPFDGVVVSVLRHAGEPVDGSPGTAVVWLAAPQPAAVTADAVADVLGRIRVGAEAEARPSGGGAAARGRVSQVARAVDPTSGVGQVRVRLDAPAAAPMLGTPVTVRVAVRQKESAVVVPRAALRRAPSGEAEVVVVVDGQASVRSVRLGIAEGERVEVVEGLDAGERVVVEDPAALADGARVDVKP